MWLLDYNTEFGTNITSMAFDTANIQRWWSVYLEVTFTEVTTEDAHVESKVYLRKLEKRVLESSTGSGSSTMAGYPIETYSPSAHLQNAWARKV